MNADLIKSASAYYEARAPWHDSYMNYTGYDALIELLKPFVDKVQGIMSGRSVLEIACGTGNWTQVLAHCASHILATDISPGMLKIAQEKLAGFENAQFQCADAYTLDNITRSFNAALGIDWWSHLPKGKIKKFLATLHQKLEPHSPVIFIDMLPTPELLAVHYYYDTEGNGIDRRVLPGGKVFEVVKNFPTPGELREALGDKADDICYEEDDILKRWILNYKYI
ncbi:MAG: class I SAM-dependent methyltransferase [Calditrichota bacterium]